MATTEVLQSPTAARLLLSPARDLHARFSCEAYHRMIDSGVIQEDSHVELIDGEIFMMSPIGPPQGSLITRLCNLLIRNLPQELDCRIQLPIVAGNHSEPEPDVAVVKRRDDDYQNEHPTPRDVMLLIEVAHSSLDFDLGPKLRLYANSRISEYWVVDVYRKAVLLHRNPSAERYLDVAIVEPGGSIAPLAAPDCKVDVAWLFRR